MLPTHSSDHAHHGSHQAHAGHDRHAGHSVEMFRQKLFGTLLFSIPTVVWASMIQQWFGYEAPGGAATSRWVPALFGSLVFAYGGWIFVRGAKGELADRRPGMMTLIPLAICVAFFFSWAVTLGFPGMDLWWELATLVTIMVLGHWVEMRSISQAQGALKELAKLVPDVATRIVHDRTEEIPTSELREGDLVLIRPGTGIPADGTVRDGTSDVNESMITGVSRPVAKEAAHRSSRELSTAPGRCVWTSSALGRKLRPPVSCASSVVTTVAGAARLEQDAIGLLPWQSCEVLTVGSAAITHTSHASWGTGRKASRRRRRRLTLSRVVHFEDDDFIL